MRISHSRNICVLQGGDEREDEGSGKIGESYGRKATYPHPAQPAEILWCQGQTDADADAYSITSSPHFEKIRPAGKATGEPPLAQPSHRPRHEHPPQTCHPSRKQLAVEGFVCHKTTYNRRTPSEVSLNLARPVPTQSASLNVDREKSSSEQLHPNDQILSSPVASSLSGFRLLEFLPHILIRTQLVIDNKTNQARSGTKRKRVCKPKSPMYSVLAV